MALDVFRITRGLELDDMQLLEGPDVPGATGDPSLAPVGSIYARENGELYTKIAAGVGTANWELLATASYVDQQIGSSVSWREPVEVTDIVSLVLPTSATNTVDGVTIVDEMRVLFTALTTTTDRNVWVATGTVGNWTWTESGNVETAGDTVYTVSGTESGKRFTHTGVAWVQTDGTTIDELGYLRDFIGKNAIGVESPNYSSVTQITQGNSLESVIGELDVAIGPDVTTNTIITNGDATNANIQSLADYVENNGIVATANTVTTVTTMDTVVGQMAKWIVRAEQVGTLANVESIEVFATHNGVDVDGTEYAKLKTGSAIVGLTFDVILTGGNTLNLTVTSTAAVNVTSKRVAVF